MPNPSFVYSLTFPWVKTCFSVHFTPSVNFTFFALLNKQKLIRDLCSSLKHYVWFVAILNCLKISEQDWNNFCYKQFQTMKRLHLWKKHLKKSFILLFSKNFPLLIDSRIHSLTHEIRDPGIFPWLPHEYSWMFILNRTSFIKQTPLFCRRNVEPRLFGESFFNFSERPGYTHVL